MKKHDLSGPPEKREFWQSVFDYGRNPGNWRPFSVAGEQSAPPADRTTTGSGVTVTPDKALRLSSVWACVGLRSALVSSLPLILRDGKKRRLTSHPLAEVLYEQPNYDMAASEFWEMMVASLDLWGNAYAVIERGGGRIVALRPLRPERMTVERASNGAISFTYLTGNREKKYRQEDIFHLRGFTVDGLIGLSPLRYAAETVGGLLTANDAATREFRNGLKVGGFLQTGAVTLTKEQRDRLRDNLGSFSSPENAAKWMVLEAGMTPVSANGIRMNPADAQLLESRYFGIEEICRAYRVPPQLIGHTSKSNSWASSLEQTNLGFLQYGLRPLLVRIEQSITRQLIPREERPNVIPKFSVEGLLRADSAGRSAFYRAMSDLGAFSVNDILDLEDRPPVDGGDLHLVQLNRTPLEEAGKPPEPAPQPLPPAPPVADETEEEDE
jgi:HK97 family phage portal protein